MKKLIALFTVVVLTGCGTLGGAMSGAGEDLNRAGEYISSVGK
jgi:predicted small secreted protein